MGSTIKQDYTNVSEEILEYLFDGYLRDGGTKTYKLREAIIGHGFSLTEVGNHLIRHHWVKNAEFRPNEFRAAISIEGIKKVSQKWLDFQFSKIIGNLILNGNKKSSVMEILELPPTKLQIGIDVTKVFQETGYAETEIGNEDILIILNKFGLEQSMKRKLGTY